MKRVAPRLSTPGPGLSQTTDARLPADLLRDQVRRLEIFAHTVPHVRLRCHRRGSFSYVKELLAGRDMASLVSEFGPLRPAIRDFFAGDVAVSALVH
jgi:hypothetical protein